MKEEDIVFTKDEEELLKMIEWTLNFMKEFPYSNEEDKRNAMGYMEAYYNIAEQVEIMATARTEEMLLRKADNNEHENQVIFTEKVILEMKKGNAPAKDIKALEAANNRLKEKIEAVKKRRADLDETYLSFGKSIEERLVELFAYKHKVLSGGGKSSPLN